MLRHRRRSRRRRFIGPLGIGVAVFIAIGLILAGNGASPRAVVGGVAAATDVPAQPSITARATPPSAAPPSATPEQSPTPRVTAPPPRPSPLVPDAPGAESGDAASTAGLTGYRWPLAHARLTLPFGATPWGGWVVDGQKFHDGVDLATFCGDKIVAAHDGVILAAGRHYDDHMGWIGDLSKYYARLDAKKLWVTLPIVVVIDDGNGFRSVYAHFGKVVVKKGQRITAGTLLGYEGRTGRASGCHLHYGLFSPEATDTFDMDPVAAKHMKLPGLEVARVDPLQVLPSRSKISPKPRPNPAAAASGSPKP